MSETCFASDDFGDDESIAAWFAAEAEMSAERLRAITLLGTVGIAHYQIGKADIEPAAVGMLLGEVDSTDDMPIKRGMYLYDVGTRAVNYLEQQVGSGSPAIWLEELSAGSGDSKWSNSVFGDSKTLALNAVTGEVSHGQEVELVELEAWNTVLLRSIPVDEVTAKLAVRIEKRRWAAVDRGEVLDTKVDKADQAKLSSEVKEAIKRARRNQRLHGIE